MEKTICEFCSWQPGRKHDHRCPELVSDSEVQTILIKAWRIGYADAVFGMDQYRPEDSYALGYSRGQADIQKAEAIDLDQIKPPKFDGEAIDDLFAGL